MSIAGLDNYLLQEKPVDRLQEATRERYEAALDEMDDGDFSCFDGDRDELLADLWDFLYRCARRKDFDAKEKGAALYEQLTQRLWDRIQSEIKEN